MGTSSTRCCSRAGVICWVVLCALSFVFKLSLPLGALTLMAVCSWIATMIVRALIRVYITRSREKGEYAYATVLVGSPEGIGESLRFLSKRSQLNYRPVGVCPIRYNDATGLIEPDRNRDELERVVSATWGSQLPVIEYGSIAWRVCRRAGGADRDGLRRAAPRFG